MKTFQLSNLSFSIFPILKHLEQQHLKNVRINYDIDFLGLKRKNEHLNALFTLDSLLKKETILTRDSFNKLNAKDDSIKLSISHNKKFSAAIVSESFNVGIDVESISDKALNISDKFISPNERLNFETINPQIATLIWSAKESMYKAYGKKNLHFKENLIIHEFDEANMEIESELKKENLNWKFLLGVLQIENELITYTKDLKVLGSKYFI